MKKFELSDDIYNIMKWIILIFVPALQALVTGLGALYGFDTTLIIGTVSLLAAFGGSLIGISSMHYNKEAREDQ